MDGQIQLTQMQPGQSGIIDSISGADNLRYRMMEMGLLPGTNVKFVRRAPLGDPIELEIRGFHLSLRSSEAEHIGVILKS